MDTDTLDIGLRVVDETQDDPDTMVVLRVSTEPCDDEEAAFVKWDFNQQPVTVADLNEHLGYAADKPFATVAFIDSLNRDFPDWETRPEDSLVQSVDARNIKTYKYPVERLQPAVDSVKV
jgi:hypothetical protein